MNLEQIEKINKGIDAVGSRYLLCLMLSQKGKKIHDREYPGDCRMAASFDKALDEILSKPNFSLPDSKPAGKSAGAKK